MPLILYTWRIIMITVEGKTTLVGVAELRKTAAEILKKLKSNKVILTKRNKPVGVILDYEEFKKIEDIMEALEDYVLGSLAQERVRRKDQKVISLDEAEKRLGLS
jgi:prevent-host-death family protein